MTADASASCARRARGFTLIELICCLVIIGILAAADGPRIFDNSSFNAHGYAQEVADAVHEAQAVAVGQQLRRRNHHQCRRLQRHAARRGRQYLRRRRRLGDADQTQ